MNGAKQVRQWFAPILILFILFQPQRADACSCAAFPNNVPKAVAMAYAHADVVFLGDVLAVRSKLIRMPPQREADFSVLALWKGKVPDNVSVRTNIGQAACGYRFSKPGRYLVFGYWDRKRGRLTTSLCDLTRREDEAEDIIDILEKMTKQSP